MFFPVIHLPLGYTSEDMKNAKRIISDISKGQRHWLVLPPGWELEFLEMK